ncbi:MAG TPA: DUF2000 domain-containing protein [Candidatus Angelobacter sp.]
MSDLNAASARVVDATLVDPLAQSHRIAIVLAQELDRGATGNRCAVLATGLTALHPEIVGKDLKTADGESLPGFTKVPITVLTTKGQSLQEMASQARAAGCTTLVFLSRAQGMRSYEAYCESVAESLASDLDVDAMLIYGVKKRVASITGALPCLR